MSDKSTIRMIRAYNQQAEAMMFLSGMFSSPAENFHTSEDIEVDVIRSDEDVAIVIQDLSTGYRMNSEDLYTNKRFKPPIFKEALPLNAFDLLKRMPGNDPFADFDFRLNTITRMFNGMRKVERKIKRSIEWQASQVLQTGIISLTDAGGNVLYTIDYKPKASHFPTAGTAWNAGGADIIGDLKSLSEEIRNDGLADPDQLLMGCNAWEAFVADDAVQKRYDTRRLDLGTISPMEMRGEGGNFRGIVEVGNYRFDIWTYGGRYKDPATGDKVQFIDPAKVIMRTSTARMDATFGAIPNFNAMVPNRAAPLLPELPRRISNGAGGVDLFTNVWLTNDGEQLFGSVGTRPLMIPTAIDTYGCLATGV